MDFEFKDIEKEDGEIAAAIKAELNRQRSNIELIASENFVYSFFDIIQHFLNFRQP